MNKGVKILAAACCLATGANAQELTDTLKLQNDNSDFTFTESQLDEDGDLSQGVLSFVGPNDDPYQSEVGFLFSPMRFRVRGYDNMYGYTYLNGLLMNDVETGRFSYGMIGGMNDAVRNKEGLSGFGFNPFGMPLVGGSTNINTRASQFAEGSKLTLSGCNRNYVARGVMTHATGLMENGWAFAGLVGYRWAQEGVIEGTFYNSLSYFLSAEKRFNDQHSLSLVTFGAPTERAQQGASTEEAYWLANSHYYNPNWGYQGGEKRNARVVETFEPTTILTWDWNINDQTKWVTSAGFKYGKYSSSALGWAGDAYDPRPDYYKNLPSSIFNVYDPNVNNDEYLAQNPFLLEQYNELKDYWISSKANRQINWDRMYFVNRQNEKLGGEALYYLERRHNDQMMGALNSTFQQTINEHNKYAIGFQFNTTKGMHYKTMEDLLGGTRYTDVDKFAANDYGPNSDFAQNDLLNPNRQIGVDDKFGYNYNIFVNKASLWGQYDFNTSHFGVNLGANIEGTTMQREGLMKNGRGIIENTAGEKIDISYGKSGISRFLGGGAKLKLTYAPSVNHIFTLAGGYDAKAPLARNSFVAPRLHNLFVDNLSVENILSSELSYKFRLGNLSGKLSGFYTRFMDQVEQTAYYNDQRNTFTYLTMNGIEKEHYGVEAALEYQVNSNLSFNLIGTISDAKYINNPNAQISYEGLKPEETARLNSCKYEIEPKKYVYFPLQVIADGMRVSGTPLTAVSLGANYNIRGWFFEANLNYYDHVYVGFSPYRRLNSTYFNSGEYLGTDKDGNVNYLGLVYKATGTNDAGKPIFTPEQINELNHRGGVLLAEDGQIVEYKAAEQEKFDGGFMLDLSIGKFIRLAKGKSLSINLNMTNVTNNTNMRTGGYEQSRDDSYYNENAGELAIGKEKPYKFSKNSKYYYANAINFFLNIGFKF